MALVYLWRAGKLCFRRVRAEEFVGKSITRIVTQAMGHMDLNDIVLGPDEVQLGSKLAQGAGGA